MGNSNGKAWNLHETPPQTNKVWRLEEYHGMTRIDLVLLSLVIIMAAQQQRYLRLIISFNDSSRETVRVKVDATQLNTVEDLKLILQTTQVIGYSSFKIELIDHSSGAFSTMESTTALNISSHHLFVHVTNLDENNSIESQLCIKGRAFDTMNGLPIRQRTTIKSLMTNVDNITTTNHHYTGEETITTTLHTIRIHEQEHADLGTGLITWDGAIVLAKYLEMHQETLIRHQRILEVGAGNCTTSLQYVICVCSPHCILVYKSSFAIAPSPT